MQRTITVTDRAQAQLAIKHHLWPFVLQLLDGGQRVDIVAKPAKRSNEHSARLHAMLGWLSKNVKWAGAYRSIDHWKRLTVSAWERARGHQVELLPALDGAGVDIVYTRTAEMSGRDMAELIQWIFWWCAEYGHDMPEYQRDPQTGRMVEYRRIKPETGENRNE